MEYYTFDRKIKRGKTLTAQEFMLLDMETNRQATELSITVRHFTIVHKIPFLDFTCKMKMKMNMNSAMVNSKQCKEKTLIRII